MPHLVKKGFLTTCLTTDSFGTHGNSGVKRRGEYAETSRNYRKWPETYRKNLVQPFGTIRSGVRVSHLGPAKKPVFDFGQKQVSFCLETIVFPETVKYKDYNRFRYPFTSL